MILWRLGLMGTLLKRLAISPRFSSPWTLRKAPQKTARTERFWIYEVSPEPSPEQRSFLIRIRNACE